MELFRRARVGDFYSDMMTRSMPGQIHAYVIAKDTQAAEQERPAH